MSAEMTANAKWILVVEDNNNLLPFFEFVLTEAGYKVIRAVNGQEGLEEYQENREHIHLVVTDLKMPVMGGLQLREQLHQETPDLPVIAVSAYTDTNEFGKDVVSKFTAVLLKPFTPGDLLNAVTTALGDQSAADSL